jgi:signal transduction histidine kinase
VLRDVEALGDLIRSEMLVQEQKNLDLACREHAGDLLRNAAEPTAVANPVEQPARNAARECGIAPRDATEERRNLLGRLGLQEVAGRARANGREQVLLRIRRGEDDDLRLRCAFADLWERGKAVHTGHREIEEHDVRLQRGGLGDGARAVLGLADDVESLLREERCQGVSSERMVVDDEHALGHGTLIGRSRRADKGSVDHARAESYRSWLLGEVLLICLLAAGTALFGASDSLKSVYELQDARLVFDTAVAVVAAFVCVLTCIRFLVEGRTLDLLLAGGFLSIAVGTVAFGLIPVLDGGSLTSAAAWQYVGARLLGAGLIAIAPYTDGRLAARRRALVGVGAGVLGLLGTGAIGMRMPGAAIPTSGELVEGSYVRVAAVLLAGLWLVALIGFWVRYRRYGRDLDSWMCLAATLAVFADLHLVLKPIVSSDFLLQGDFLRVLAYGILVVGVWRAISQAEFGRAVADERARVAREIHDGLAQYLFAISTQVSMLESGAPLGEVLPRLKRAATSAQQEARFAVLALSSAGGSARFDSALRRYVEVLTADGELDVEVDVDSSVRLAPDEQIEVFRIVQEGLGNARRHAGARHVEVSITQRTGRRVVLVSDDGVGFDEADVPIGQGIANMRLRAEAIEGELTLRSRSGRGTAIEVVLRPA